MAQVTSAAFVRVSSSALEGRATYHRFKQEQLAVLFNLITSNSAAIVSAAATDTGRTPFELELELTLVLRHVDALFKASDFEGLEKIDRHNLASGSIVKPIGAVVIIGGVEAPLDSWISPLATAIASGNTALTLLPETPKLVELFLPLLQGLNQGGYQFLPSTAKSLSVALSLPSSHTVLTSRSPTARKQVSEAAISSTLLPSALGTTPLIITESNSTPLSTIANQIARGTNTISYVLVHEELAAELIDHLVVAFQKAFGSDPKLSSDARKTGNTEISIAVEGQGQVIYGGVGKDYVLPTLVGGVRRDSPLLRDSTGPIVPIVFTSSLEDAIAIAADGLGSVAYGFGNSRDLQYLAAGLAVGTFYSNEIPLESLVGEVAVPSNEAFRYSLSLFQKTTKIVPPRSTPISSLYAPFTLSAFKKIQALRGTSTTKRVVRQSHPPLLRRSFFPQGLFIIAGTVFSAVLGGTGLTVYSLIRFWLARSSRVS